jgi:hypothetical protein
MLLQNFGNPTIPFRNCKQYGWTLPRIERILCLALIKLALLNDIRIQFFDRFQNGITHAGVSICGSCAKHAHPVVKFYGLQESQSTQMSPTAHLNEKIIRSI